MRRHYDLKDIYGESPIVVEACREYFMRQIHVVENHLNSRKTILKDGFGIADIFLMTCLDWAIFYEFSLPDNVTQYRDRIAFKDRLPKSDENKLFKLKNGTSKRVKVLDLTSMVSGPVGAMILATKR